MATPDSTTKRAAIQLLLHGKANAAEAARKAGVTRQAVVLWVDDARIGKPLALRARFLDNAWECMLKIAAAVPAGLRPDLRLDIFPGKFRCAKCELMQKAGSVRVWVRRRGRESAWCVSCAQKLG